MGKILKNIGLVSAALHSLVSVAPDGDINDADLHISAPDKLRFFSELENELAVELANKIRSATSIH